MRTAILATVVAAAAAAGCPGRDPAPPPIANTVAATAARPEFGVERAVASLPADSEVVGVADLERLKASSAGRAVGGRVYRRLLGEVTVDKAPCIEEILGTVTWVAVALSTDEQDLTMFVHGPGRDDVIACAARLPGTAPPIIDGDYVEFVESDQRRALLFVDDHTFALSTVDGRAVDRATLQRAVDGSDGVGRSEVMQALLDGTDTRSPLWFVSRQRGAGEPYRSVRGWFEVGPEDGDGLRAHIVAEMPTADARNMAALVDQARGQAHSGGGTPPVAAKLLDGLRVQVGEGVLRAELVIDDRVLSDALALLGM